jgi:hypothetical protein
MFANGTFEGTGRTAKSVAGSQRDFPRENARKIGLYVATCSLTKVVNDLAIA